MKSIVVGLGNIGMNYDYNFHPNEKIHTHAQSLKESSFFKLSGGVDLSLKKRKKFEKKFKRPSFSNIKNAIKKIKPSLVVIAVPTEIHEKIFYEVLKYSFVKVIVCEKPIAKKYILAKKMVNNAKKKKKILIINYFRNFEPGYLEIYKIFKKNSLKNSIDIKILYNRGLYNNASHYLDLILKFMGKVLKIKVYKNEGFWNLSDPEPNFKIYFKNGFAEFKYRKNIKYCKMKIKSKYISVDYLNNGKNIKVIDNKIKKNIKSYFNFYQKYVYENIYNYLKNKTKISVNTISSVKLLKYLNYVENKIYEK